MEHGVQVYDKKHACVYCGVAAPKPAHNLVTHKIQEETKHVLSLDKKADKVERSEILRKLRLKGDFYQVKVLKTGGNLFVIRRPKEGVNADPNSFLPCRHCYGFVHKGQLSRHSNRCKSAPGNFTTITIIS